MFELFGAIFGGTYLAVKSGSSKASLKDAKKKIYEYECAKDDWGDKYTNKHLEEQLFKYISKPENFSLVTDEIREVYLSMPHWHTMDIILCEKQLPWKTRTESKKNKDFVIISKRIIVDILLAKQGIVSTYASQFGYNAFSSNELLSIQMDELVHWILYSIKKQGIDLEIKENGNPVNPRYVWVGSWADRLSHQTSSQEGRFFDSE